MTSRLKLLEVRAPSNVLSIDEDLLIDDKSVDEQDEAEKSSKLRTCGTVTLLTPARSAKYCWMADPFCSWSSSRTYAPEIMGGKWN